MTADKPIFARNLTARAERRVSGNPDISRPEDVVGNCFPGLEMDLRTLDRRFFPGLVFDFLSSPDNTPSYLWQGARLAYCDPHNDPDLQGDYPHQLPAGPERTIIEQRRAKLLATLVDAPLFRQLNEGAGWLLSDAQRAEGVPPPKGFWYLGSVTVHVGDARTTIGMSDPHTKELWDGLVVWRLIRSLSPTALDIHLVWRPAPNATNAPTGPDPKPVTLEGWRRRFTNPRTGVLSGAYQPGELTMSMCSPWQHDFRDCACHYWASNRPDIVFGEVDPGQVQLPGGTSADPILATTRLDWMRADRSPEAAAGAMSTMNANRPFQLDHYQINTEWQRLSVVLKNTEIGDVYTPPPINRGSPFASPLLLCREMPKLAGLEMTLALEYLYAYFSIITEAEAEKLAEDWPAIVEDVGLARHTLLLIAISEMQHLRLANELMWALQQAFPDQLSKFKPILSPAERVPVPGRTPGTTRSRELRRLTPRVLDEMIAVEQPSGGIDGEYAQVIATLSQPIYPKDLHELASRIANDGTQHYSRLERLQITLGPYGAATPYLRDVKLADHGAEGVQEALTAYKAILSSLGTAYAPMDVAAAPNTDAMEQARTAMTQLLHAGEKAASKNLGVPFW